jgi:hypothetical protein
MSVGSLKAKEKAKKRLPDNYIQTEEEEKAYLYCVKNNIIISPVAVKDTIGSWAVGISLPGNHKKVHNSPEICDKHSIWQIFYKYCKYYYDKNKK